MIPIIVITESGESFNYFDEMLIISHRRDNEDNKYYSIRIPYLDGYLKIYETDNKLLRDKVLELLHKEAAGCFLHTKNVSNKDAYNRTYYTKAYATDQVKFQIYLSEIIEKAKGELI